MVKHAPKHEADLIVHKKKVAEVHAWMDAAANAGGPACAIVTGAALWSLQYSGHPHSVSFLL